MPATMQALRSVQAIAKDGKALVTAPLAGATPNGDGPQRPMHAATSPEADRLPAHHLPPEHHGDRPVQLRDFLEREEPRPPALLEIAQWAVVGDDADSSE